MSTNLTVNGSTFAYPENREEPGWGEEASGWAGAVTDAIASLLGTNDIIQTSFNVTNNVSSATNVVGLIFNTATVRAAIIEYSIYRFTDSSEVVEQGTMDVIYKSTGATWDYSQSYTGNSGVTLSITNAGQVQYTSSNLAGTNYTGTMRFRARTLAQ